MDLRLAQLITSLGIKKIDFAMKIGFSQAYISMILSGKKTNPSPRFFDTIGRVFQVNVAWLREGKGEMYAIPGSDIPARDAELLVKFRLLPLRERRMIADIVDALLLKNITETRNEEKV